MTAWTRASTLAARAALDAELASAVALRHELHAHPDLSGAEGPTTARMLDSLRLGDGPDVSGGRVLRLGGPGHAVGLRTELDALPLTEQTGLPWAAPAGAAHACGHDVHMAALVAVVGALRTAGAPVPLVAVLQPREEAVPSGAADMVAAEELLMQDVQAMVGVHVQPRIPAGTYSAVPGAVNASSDDFVIELRSHGGHAGYPHVSGDPVVAAASLIVALQSVVARQIDPLHPAVVTVGSIRAGEAPNVIPDRATLEGTIRAFDPADRALLREKVARAAEQAASLHGCTLDLAMHAGEPPLVNDPHLASLAGQWIDSMTGRTGVDLRSCGSDDFSYYGTKFPSVMVFYGLGDARPDSPGLHHPRFAPSDDDVGGVAECLLAGYFAGCELILGPPEGS